MDTIDLSVILPSYNVSKYIRNSIESIISQTGVSYEIIIVDDGSTDETLSLLNKYYKSNPNISIIHQENQGSGIARNTGLSKASGKYVYFMDPDDSIAPGMFYEIFKKISLLNCNPDMILFGYYSSYSDSKKIKHHKYNLDEEFLKNSSSIQKKIERYGIEGVIFPVWNKFLNRKFLKNTGIVFTDQRTGQDALFSLDIFQKVNNLYFIPKEYYHYLAGRSNSAYNTKNPSKVNDEINILDNLHHLYLHFGIKDRKFISSYIINIINNEIRNNYFLSLKDFFEFYDKSKVNKCLTLVNFESLSFNKKIIFLLRRHKITTIFLLIIYKIIK